MSLLPLISGSGRRGPYNREVVVSQVGHRDTVRDWFTPEWRRRSVRTDTEKYIKVEKNGTEELYDLNVDPGEKMDIATDSEEGLLEYRGLLDTFLKAVSSGRAPLSESERRATPLTEDDRRRLKALGYI